MAIVLEKLISVETAISDVVTSLYPVFSVADELPRRNGVAPPHLCVDARAGQAQEAGRVGEPGIEGLVVPALAAIAQGAREREPDQPLADAGAEHAKQIWPAAVRLVAPGGVTATWVAPAPPGPAGAG